MRRLTSRIITSVLSTCMIFGSMPAYAYAASSYDGIIVQENDSIGLSQETDYDEIDTDVLPDYISETNDIIPLGDTDVVPPFTLSGDGFSYDYTFDEETGTLTVTGSGDCHYLFYDGYTAKDNPWVFYNRGKINKVVLNSTGLVDASNLFHGLFNVTEIDLSGFDSSTVTDMSNMFDSCMKLTTVDLSGLDTSKVTNMKYMFGSCWALETIDVSGFDTSKVSDMSGMFSFCKAVKTLNVSSFDTSNVTDMEYMFSNCGALTGLDLSNFNTECVTSMSGMFLADSELKSLNVSSFNTSNVTDMTCIFSGLSSLTKLDFTNFDTGKVEKFEKFIGHCKSLTSVDLSHLDTSSAIDMSSMFEECKSLTSLDVSHFDVSKVRGMSFMFEYCSSLKSLDLSNWNVASVDSLAGFIQFDYALESFKTPYNNTDEYYLPVTMYDENNVEYSRENPIYTTNSLNLHIAGADPAPDPTPAPGPVQVPVASIYLPDEKEINIPAGSAITITPEFEPGNATDKSLNWESSKPDIAYITESGVIVGKSEGEAIIKAYAQDGSGVVSNDITVHVIGNLFDDDEEEIDEVLEKDKSDPNRNEGLWITTIDDTNIYCTGRAITPPVRVYDGNRLLKEKTDYTLSYYNNKAVYEISHEESDDDDSDKSDGIDSAFHREYFVNSVDLSVPMVVAKLKGSYGGTLISTFSIHKSDKTAQSLQKATITLNPAYSYNGEPVEPEPVVKLGSETLTEGTDYILVYSNNEKIGKGKLTVIGVGFYYGTKTATFAITGRDFTDNTIHVNNDEPITAIYSASGAKPSLKVTYGTGEEAVVLKEGVDYTIKYSNNKAVTGPKTKKMPSVTLTGTGFYKGKFSKNFTILQKDFSVVTILATDKPEAAKAGKYTTTIKVTDIDGTVLKPGKDYEKTIRYIEWNPKTETKGQLLDKNSKPKAGDTIRLEIKGKGNYTDSVAVGYFHILSANMDIAKAKVTIKDQMFAGKGVAVKIPENDLQFTVKMGGKDIRLATEKNPDGFEIVPGSYMNNTKLGTAKVTIHGTGIYGGYKTIAFKIVAKTKTNNLQFPGFDGPIKNPRPSYVEGELICLADSEEEANSIADDYGIIVKDFSYGVAVFDCGDKDLFELIEFGKAHGLKELSLNHIYYLDDPVNYYVTYVDQERRVNYIERS